MNLLFISSVEYETLDERNIYTDLLREFRKNGWGIYAISPRNNHLQHEVVVEENTRIIRPLMLKMQKVNYLKKAIALLSLGKRYTRAINKYVGKASIDLILYATPPVNIVGVIEYCKEKFGSKTYLMLKDIWPDGIADLGAIKKDGLIYRYFRSLEKRLYKISDTIGCMSQANIDYVLKNNSDICKQKMCICPNSIDILDMRLTNEQKREVRVKYRLPLDKKIFVYGGNLGKPQDVPYIVECLKASWTVENAYFVISGNGTDRHYLDEYMVQEKPQNVRLFNFMPKDEYDALIACCDVGLIFLNHRFTIPNFPSRLLSYMQAGLPVLACTDKNSDLGKIIADSGFGWWCESNDPNQFMELINRVLVGEENVKRESYEVLIEKFSVKSSYNIIRDCV